LAHLVNEAHQVPVVVELTITISLMNIERKLEEIKKINIAKDEVEKGLTALQSIGLDPELKATLEFKEHRLVIPEVVKQEVFDVIKTSLLEMKEKLIESATQLMK
jgi:hypothetical protein